MKPVVALDVDGTLLAYHVHFITFAQQYFGKEIDLAYDARIPLNKHCGVSKAAYRQCKLAYRRGELKRSLPVLPAPYPHARTLTKTLRSWGCDVWLCTTRPYLSHDVVDDATRHNLRRNGVVYQGLIWGERKYHELVRTVSKARIVGVLEDDPSLCTQAERLGLRVAFARRSHNERQLFSWSQSGIHPWAVAETEEDTLALFKKWLLEWQDRA